jgi:hypothetical protein
MKRSHNLLNTVKQSLNPINKILVGVSPLWQTPSLTSDPHDPYTVEKLSMRRTIWYPTHGHRTRPDPNQPDSIGPETRTHVPIILSHISLERSRFEESNDTTQMTLRDLSPIIIRNEMTLWRNPSIL